MLISTEIKNRVLKTELVEWRKLVELQPKNFKELTTINYEKLKQSILKENFVMSFTVWQSKDTVYIIDGHHRYKVLDLLEKEGVNVPDKLPCTFIECKDIKEAKKLVLTYSSNYAKVQEEGLYEFLNVNDFDFESLKNEIDIPNIDFEKFESGFLKDYAPENKEKEISELELEHKCPKCGYEY